MNAIRTTLVTAASEVVMVYGGALAAGAARDAYTRELRDAITSVRRAVEASGFRSELWTYALRGGRMVAERYGIGADVQLWSTTDLAVQYALSRLGR